MEIRESGMIVLPHSRPESGGDVIVGMYGVRLYIQGAGRAWLTREDAAELARRLSIYAETGSLPVTSTECSRGDRDSAAGPDQ